MIVKLCGVFKYILEIMSISLFDMKEYCATIIQEDLKMPSVKVINSSLRPKYSSTQSKGR